METRRPPRAPAPAATLYPMSATSVAASFFTDESREPPATVRRALLTLRSSLRSETVDDNTGDDVRTAIRLLCVFARQEQMPAEELIVAVKRLLAESPELDALDPEKRAHACARIIEFTMRSYFSDRA